MQALASSEHKNKSNLRDTLAWVKDGIVAALLLLLAQS